MKRGPLTSLLAISYKVTQDGSEIFSEGSPPF